MIPQQTYSDAHFVPAEELQNGQKISTPHHQERP